MADVLLNIIGKIEDVKKDLAKVKTEMKKVGDRSKKANEQMQKQFKKSSKVVGDMRNMIIGMFGISVLGSKLIQGIKASMQVIRDFEKTFTNVLTLLDEADKKRFEGVLREGSLDLMSEYGLEIEDVNKALFDTISAGISAGEAIGFMDDASVLAIAGATSLSAAVKGTTAILNAYNLESSESEKIAAALFSAQKKGVTTVELLSEAIGRVAPIAAGADISYQELLATFATLTKRIGSTEETATALRSAIAALIKPSEQAKKKFAELGIETGVTAIQNNGLIRTLKNVVDATKDDADIITELIPNQRALLAILSLNEKSLSENDETLRLLNEDYGENSSIMNALAEQMDTIDFKTKALKGTWEKLVVTIGGGESIFTKLWKETLTNLTTGVEKATESINIFAEGTWANRIKLYLNMVLKNFKRLFFPIFKLIEKITGKEILTGFKIEVEEVKAIIPEITEVVEKEAGKESKIITKLTDEEIKARKKAAAIAKKAAIEKAKAIAKANEDLVGKIKELQIAITTDEIEQIEKRKQLEIDKINDSLASEENKTKAIKLIRKKYNEEIKTLMDAGYADAQAKEQEFQENIQQLKEKYGLVDLKKQHEDELAELEKHKDELFDTEEEYLAKVEELKNEYDDKEIETWYGKLGRINEIIEEWKEYVDDIVYAMSDLFQTQQNNDTLALEKEKDVQLARVKGNKDAEIKINEEFTAKKEAIEKKYAEKQQKIALIMAIINTALGISKAIAQGGILGIVTGILVAAAGALQIATIAGQKFAEGGYTGEGSGQRDETGQRQAGVVHEREFVMDKKTTSKYRPELDAMQSGTYERLPFDIDTWGKLQKKEQQFAFSHQVSLDDSKDLKEIRKLLEIQGSKKEIQRFEDSQFRYEISNGFEKRIKKHVS